MKKTYIEPNVNVVNVTVTHHLLAGSGDRMSINSGETVDSTEDLLSRQSGNWSDED